MKKEKFNNGWTVRSGVADAFDAIFGKKDPGLPVTLPHDAMIYEERDPMCKSGTQTGFYPAKSYTYMKEFEVPKAWEDQQVCLEFEGVMRKAMVYINGEFAGKHRYGYSQFFIDMSPYLKYGENNSIKVIAVNQDMASRWYPGSGIYRDVNLLTGGFVHVVPEGIRITTEDVEEDYAVILVEAAIKNAFTRTKKVRLAVSFRDNDGNLAAFGENVVSVGAMETVSSRMRITVSSPMLWELDSPYLYQCVTEIYEGEDCLDITEETFGIRTMKLDARKGLRINDKEVKLRGCCIHHDNGIIGAATLYHAEEFRLRQLKEAGFNSIRSAHNPMSKAMLKACDRLGILVMDELSDMWNEPKNCNDFGLDFEDVWQEEAARMVSKDYNHPSVVFYSLGNEIPEIGRQCGGRMNRKIAGLLRKLDHTRYTTNAFSGFLAVTDYIAEMAANMAEMKQKQQETKEAGQTESRGSEGLNNAMGQTQKEQLAAFAINPVLTKALEEAACELDVAGYNYLTGRHELEHELHPDRVVVGSETYPTEIADLWEIVIKNKHVIGDYTWTGYDYLGEAGIGIYHYDTDRKEQGWYPDRIAYCGDINLNAYRRPVSYLREIAMGLRREPFIAVERVDRYGKDYDKNNWMYINAIDSWTFKGYEGKPSRVSVLSASEEVELFLNGVSLGRKPVGSEEKLTAIYELTYEPGELLAVGYEKGVESGRMVLKTAEAVETIKVTVVNEQLEADGQGAAFLIADLADRNGITNRWEAKEVSVSVEGPGSLLGFGSADPSNEGSYQDTTWKTFDGRVMAVIRSGRKPGKITVTFTAKGCKEQRVVIHVLEPKTP